LTNLVQLHKKIKVSPLKWEPTNRERQPQEPYREPAGMPKEKEMEPGSAINVNDQPPASQLTTKNAMKHNAGMSQVGGERCKGRPKNTTRPKEGGDFWRLAKQTLVSLRNHTCTFAIMFWCI